MPSRQRVNWAWFRSATIILAAAAILIVLMYLLSGGTLLQQKATVYLYIPDATGVGPGSPVRVDGITVGKVTAVGLSGSQQPQRVVRVVMRVEKKNLLLVPADSYAQLSTESLIGDKYVDITSGRRAESLRPGAEIVYREDPNMMKSLDLEQFQKNLRAVDAMLTDIETGRSRVGRFILQDDMYRDLLKEIGDIETAVRKAAATSGSIGEDLYTDKLIRQISAPVMRLDRGLAALQSGQGTMGRLLRDSAQYDSIVAAAQKLRQGIADLRSNDLMRSDRLYTGLTRWLAHTARSVDEFNASPQFGNSAMYDNLNGTAKQLETTVRDFREHPHKYLRLKLF